MSSSGAGGGSTTALGSVGNQAIDKWDATFIAAGEKYGVDPRVLKAMAVIESGGAGANTGSRDDGFGDGLSVGMMQVKPKIWGPQYPQYDPYTPEGNIWMGAAIMGENMKQYGGWEGALTNVYFPTTDPNGTTQNMYVDEVNNLVEQMGPLQAAAPTGQERLSAGGYPTGTSDPNGSAIVDEAVKYVGVAYNWGAIPGAGSDPWASGWDCSGFVYWLDQNYGGGDVPMGSHYQYQWAADTGRLNQDPSQLQSGDLVFFDTGLRGGGGAELNGASHVGVYIGDGQFIHAANPTDGTLISSLDSYMNMYPYLGSANAFGEAAPAPAPTRTNRRQGGSASEYAESRLGY
ncbi:MAG: NlpC/P60 family protein [Pseudomonadota bacterium]|nr:NlpC/P60 family protein [Pseudomonadota bacterium]